MNDLVEMEAGLSGDDSPLPNLWEEIKEQVQNESSVYWPAYLQTMEALIDSVIDTLAPHTQGELSATLRTSSIESLQRVLMERLLARAKKERIKYAPFDFAYFCYPLLDFTAYGQVLRRVGVYECEARVYSAAAPYGEHGVVNVSRIEHILTKQQFELAQVQHWPDEWSGA